MADTILESIAVNFFANVGPLVQALTRAQQVTYEYGVSVQRANQLEETSLSIKTKYERSLGDLNEMYHRGLISLQAYNKELERLQGGSFSDRMAQGMHAFAGASTRAIGAVRDGASLLRGEFNTVGEAMGKVGSMATLIPGPWGQAIGSVITVVGELIDLINHGLIQAQQAAKREFMAIAEGAKTAAQAARSIEAGVMREGLERMVRDRQMLQQSGISFEQQGLGETLFGGQSALPRGMQQQASQARTQQWMQSQLQMRREQLDMLLNDPGLREGRQRLAELEIGGGLQDRPIQLEEHAARRRMMMQMHRPVTGGPEQQALAERQLANANERLAVMQLIRRSGRDANGEMMTYGQAELALREQIRVSNVALIEDMRRRRTERMEEHAAQATQKWREEMQKLADVTTQQRMVQTGALPFELKQLEERLKVESELTKLRDQGMSVRGLSGRRGELEQAMNQRLLNDQLKEANQIANSLITPEEKYEDTLANLNRLLAGGFLAQENFNRALERARETYEGANSSLKELNSQAQRGASIVEGYRDPWDKLDDKLRDLRTAYELGRIQLGEYSNAVMRVRAEQDKLNMSMGKTQAVAYGSAEAMGKLRDYMERVTPGRTGATGWEGMATRIRDANQASGLSASAGNPGVMSSIQAMRGAGAGGPVDVLQEVIRLGMSPGFGLSRFGRSDPSQNPLQGFNIVRVAVDAGNEILRAILNALNANNPDAPEQLPQPAEIG